MGDLLTIAEVVCAPRNANVFANLCTAIQAAPGIYDLLDDNLGFDFINGIFVIGIPDRIPVVDGRGGRKLQGNARGLTLFAPNNEAFTRLLRRRINTLFNQAVPEVVSYFQGLGVDIVVDTGIVENFFFSVDGQFFLRQLLLEHIVGRELPEMKLTCNRVITMLSNGETATQCIRNNNNKIVRKNQVGEGNNQRNAPRIINADVGALNGVIHVVNNVILPQRFLLPDVSNPGEDFPIPFLPPIVNSGPLP